MISFETSSSLVLGMTFSTTSMDVSSIISGIVSWDLISFSSTFFSFSEPAVFGGAIGAGGTIACTFGGGLGTGFFC